MWTWVARELDAVLAPLSAPGASRLVGVTGLAAGADSVFAAAVLALGGTLHVVLAYEGFERSLESGGERDELARLLARAEKVETLAQHESDDEAYLSAGKRVVELSDLLVAVWNGEPARGVGGTGDVVGYAIRTGTPVVHLDPFRERVERSGGS